MGDRHNATVHWTRLLLREPLGDAGVAESMFTMRCLDWLLQDSTANRTNKIFVNIPLETGYIIPHVSSLKPRSFQVLGGQVPFSQGSNPLMPPTSATQETLPVTHLVGYSSTESSFLVTNSIAKGMNVMSQSGALALEAV